MPEYVQDPIRTVIIKPPLETDIKSPPFANEVRVLGGSDAVTVHFYFISGSRVATILGGGDDPHMLREDDVLKIESEPVARVAIPLTAAGNLMAALAEIVVGGMPELQESLNRINDRINALNKKSGTENG